MSPKQAGKKFFSMADKVTANVAGTLQSEQARTKQIGIDHTSGSFSQAQLDAMGNPYGHGEGLGARSGISSRRGYAPKVRGPIPYGDETIANAQSHDLQTHWKPGAIYTDSLGTLHGPVNNDSRDARWFDGQPHGHTIARDLGGAVAKQAEKGFFDRIQSAIKRALK